MFSSFKLPNFRTRSRSLCNAEKKDLGKPPKTPVGSPKQKKLHKRRTSDVGCPSISALRPGSVSQQSDQLVPGDRVHSVNGINTCRMRTEEVNTLLDNVDERALLEIEYSMYNYNSQNSLCVSSKIANIPVERIDGSLGITLRGGLQSDPLLNKPLVVTHVRPHGPVHRTGRIKIGDRLLKVDNHSLANKTLLEAQQLLRASTAEGGTGTCTLTIEYDIGVMESVRYATGPLLVEVERRPAEDLGLVLSNCCEFGADEIITAGIYVESVVPASVADRCGALNVGDQLLAVDEQFFEGTGATPSEVMRLLQNCNQGYTRLQILPYHAVSRRQTGWMDRGNGGIPGSPSPSGFSTMASRRSRFRNRGFRQSSAFKYYDNDSGLSHQGSSSNYCGYSPQLGVCHVECLTVSLSAGGGGYGLKVGVDNSTGDQANIVITHVTTDSPAYKCGCLQVGDRVLSLNHQANLTVQEVDSLLDLGSGGNTKLVLQVEYDVADSIVPSSGIFTVKLARRGPDLGITITASKSASDEPFVISDVRRGSVAQRTGSLRVGDRLLAVDGRPLDRAAVEAGALGPPAASAGDIVTLRVHRPGVGDGDDCTVVESVESVESGDGQVCEDVVYTVELTRNGGPLGVTISGSEDCSEPIVLSRLTQGGVAERTGALHVGDRILAIDGQSVRGRPLSAAVQLLQAAGDRVQVRVARPTAPVMASPGSSAAESWDSGVQPDGTACVQPQPPAMLPGPGSELHFYSDAEESVCPSPLPLPNYSFTNTLGSRYEPGYFCSRLDAPVLTHRTRETDHERYDDSCSLELNEIHHVTLYKDSIYDDYGFSVSDGLYERGVYINRIRRGGPAHMAGSLKPYDRILQVNDTKTQDFDCCLTVPLIASAGDKIELIVSRNPYMNYVDDKDVAMLSWTPTEHEITSFSPKPLSSSQNTITKTL